MTTDNLTIAKTILEQLGGRRFAALTGARDFSACRNGLVFHLPSYMAQQGINLIRITLSPATDTYRVEFSKIRGVQIKTISTHDDIYCDALAALFTAQTGLVTTM